MLTALSMQISNLARALLPITVKDGELIYRQGEPGETFFIVMTGEVERVRIVTHTNTKAHMHMHIYTRIRTHTSSCPPSMQAFTHPSLTRRSPNSQSLRSRPMLATQSSSPLPFCNLDRGESHLTLLPCVHITHHRPSPLQTRSWRVQVTRRQQGSHPLWSVSHSRLVAASDRWHLSTSELHLI